VTAGILSITWRGGTEEQPNYWNDSFSAHPELDAFILEGNSSSDPDSRHAAYARAQEYIADHALAIGVYDRLSTLAVGGAVDGIWQERSQGGPVFHDAYLLG